MTTPLVLLAALCCTPLHAQEGIEALVVPMAGPAAAPAPVTDSEPAPVVLDTTPTAPGPISVGTAEEPLPIPPVEGGALETTATLEVPAITPAEDIPAPTPQDAAEQTVAEGIELLRDIVVQMNSVRNAQTADAAAQAVNADLDRLREWNARLRELLQNPDNAAAYNRGYRPTAEKLCLALAEYSVQLVNADYFQSADLRQTLLRMSKELPAAFELRENARWTCTGITLLSMLDAELAGIGSTPAATQAAGRVQELVDALQPWRQAARPAGAATAGKRYLKSYQSFIDREDLRLQMQAKRIVYADFFHAENLALPILQVTDSLADICAFPAEERHIRAGIVLLGVLENILAQVKDTDSARAATTPIMRLSTDLQQWGQGFAALPEPDEAVMQRYEKRYLPRIEQLNDRIKAQGARIASAEFYRSRELPTALLRLIMNFQ